MREARAISGCFYDSKTSCFGIVEGLSFTVKYHTFHTKTTCFGVVMLSDTFLRTITLINNLTLNTLEAKVTLSSKQHIQKFGSALIVHVHILILPSLGPVAGLNPLCIGRLKDGSEIECPSRALSPLFIGI